MPVLTDVIVSFSQLGLYFMHLLTFEYLAALRFDGAPSVTLRALKEYHCKQKRLAAQLLKAIKGLSQIAMVEPAESCSQLDGAVVALPWLKTIGICNGKPKSRLQHEIAGCREALVLVQESAACIPFSESVVFQPHTLTCRYMLQGAASNNDIIERQAN